MAQVELRFFDQGLGNEAKAGICDFAQGVVFRTHYPDDVAERERPSGILTLQPGDITLVVPQLNYGLSRSDAQYELEISEGSDNWPRDEHGQLLAEEAARAALQARADRISQSLRQAYGMYSHNIFEVTGQGTGWAQYKPASI